jgi:hypothetical protein
MKSEYLTPRELREKYPSIPFTESELGILLSLKLVIGAKKNKLTLIDENSLITVCKFRNEVLKKAIIEFN